LKVRYAVDTPLGPERHLKCPCEKLIPFNNKNYSSGGGWDFLWVEPTYNDLYNHG
jgi:hypothetical protein